MTYVVSVGYVAYLIGVYIYVFSQEKAELLSEEFMSRYGNVYEEQNIGKWGALYIKAIQTARRVVFLVIPYITDSFTIQLLFNLSISQAFIIY